MSQVAALVGELVLLAWLAWNLWSLVRIATGLRDRAWRRPMWWTRLCSISLFAGLISWFCGAVSGGLDVREACQLNRHERYDEAYRDAHAVEFQRIFPLHNKCNAQYDLVSAWVNPVIVSCVAVFLLAVAVLLWFSASRLANFARREARSRA